MADYQYKSRADGQHFHPANVCTRDFVFGSGKDRNRGKHKVESHSLPELFSNVHANTNRNEYGGYEGGNSKFCVSEPAYNRSYEGGIYSVSEPAYNRNEYGGYEGGNSKFSVSEPAYNGYEGINNSKLSASEPTLIDSDGRLRPSRTGWSMPSEVPLSKVTRDVDAAADYLRGSAAPQSSGLFGADQWSSATSAPSQARRATATINSEQAARKYGGQFIW